MSLYAIGGASLTEKESLKMHLLPVTCAPAELCSLLFFTLFYFFYSIKFSPDCKVQLQDSGTVTVWFLPFAFFLSFLVAELDMYSKIN
jgi:hypothetical protein